jgi:hypothetical protein
MTNIDFSRPEYMFAALQSLFQNSMGVNPAGVSGQPVTSTIGAPWESIKGCAGSSLPSRRLTEYDFPAPRKLAPSFPEGGAPVIQNDLVCTAPAPGQPVDQGFYGDGNTDLGLLHYGVGARLQFQSSPRPHMLRSEGPGSVSRDIFSESMSSERSGSGGTEVEAGRGVTEPGATPGKITPIGTGNISDSAHLHPSQDDH